MVESRCGLLCSQCPHKEEYGCEGCISMPEGYWGSECEIKACCELKNLEHCGVCKEFPCKLLKDISFDLDTGDDGERLMNCKNWSETKSNLKWSLYNKLLLGFSIGIIIGLIIGVIQNMITAWLFAGSLIGIAIGLIVYISRNK